MTPLEEIEEDLNWREGELSVLRLLLSDTNIVKREKSVLFRAAWALLYAHYEGFCKFALAVYYDAVNQSGKPCSALPFNTQCFALHETIKEMRNMPRSQFLFTVINFESLYLKSPPKFPDIETDSNLFPSKLKELLDEADLVLPSLSLHNRKLETLVRRRNKIAHGERDLISELDYYLQFEHAFKIVAYELAYAIDDKLSRI